MGPMPQMATDLPSCTSAHTVAWYDVGNDVAEVEGLLIRHRGRDREQIGVGERAANVFGLPARETAGEV